MKRALKKVLLAGVVVTGLLAPQPARAATRTTEGSLAFVGTADLPTFPCAAPSPGAQPCNGTFTGNVAGTLAGLHNDIPWAIVVNTPVTSSAPIRYTYADNIEPGIRCVEGVARATASVTADGLQNQVLGVYGNINTTQLPRTVTKAVVDFSFSWYRVGVTANMKFDKLVITLTLLGDPITKTVVAIDNTDSNPANDSPTGVVGYGAAGFVPTNFSQAHAAACDGTSTATPPLSAQVAGNVEFAV